MVRRSAAKKRPIAESEAARRDLPGLSVVPSVRPAARLHGLATAGEIAAPPRGWCEPVDEPLAWQGRVALPMHDTCFDIHGVVLRFRTDSAPVAAAMGTLLRHFGSGGEQRSDLDLTFN